MSVTLSISLILSIGDIDYIFNEKKCINNFQSIISNIIKNWINFI